MATQINVTWIEYTPRSTEPAADVLEDLFARDDSRSIRHHGVLTCDHAASSRGLPVLVLADGTALGVAEIDADLGYYDLDVQADGEETPEVRGLLDAAIQAGYRLAAVHSPGQG